MAAGAPMARSQLLRICKKVKAAWYCSDAKKLWNRLPAVGHAPLSRLPPIAVPAQPRPIYRLARAHCVPCWYAHLAPFACWALMDAHAAPAWPSIAPPWILPWLQPFKSPHEHCWHGYKHTWTIFTVKEMSPTYWFFKERWGRAISGIFLRFPAFSKRHKWRKYFDGNTKERKKRGKGESCWRVLDYIVIVIL